VDSTDAGHQDPEHPDEAAAHVRRARSFGRQARAYATFRPSYPADAVRWALEPVAAGRPLSTLRVLDLAAGTGKLTEVVAGLGATVVAVEPDTGMLAELRRRLPAVTGLTGRAEEIPAPDQAFDAAVVGQAFHWFDREAALAEIARVLRPGGTAAALWNLDDDRVPWVAGLGQISQRQGSLARFRDDRTFVGHPAFEEIATAEFDHRVRQTSEQVVGLVATTSSVLVLPDDERVRVLARVRGYLRARPETASGEFEVPMVTGVVRAVRVGPRALPAGSE
jgi:SAM-dependent methyltransferase